MWPETSTWHSWIIKFINNGKGFPSLDGMACSNLWHDQASVSTKALACQKVLDFLRPSDTQFIW